MNFCVQSGLICLQLYPDQEGVSTVPREVELALANGLSLADQPSRALSLLKNTRYMYTICNNTVYTEDCMMQAAVELELELTLFRSRSVPMKCLALLLESALREENFTIAAEVCTCNLYYLEGANMFMFVVITFSVML